MNGWPGAAEIKNKKINNPRARGFFVRAADLREVGNLYSPASLFGRLPSSNPGGRYILHVIHPILLLDARSQSVSQSITRDTALRQ